MLWFSNRFNNGVWAIAILRLRLTLTRTRVTTMVLLRYALLRSAGIYLRWIYACVILAAAFPRWPRLLEPAPRRALVTLIRPQAFRSTATGVPAGESGSAAAEPTAEFLVVPPKTERPVDLLEHPGVRRLQAAIVTRLLARCFGIVVREREATVLANFAASGWIVRNLLIAAGLGGRRFPRRSARTVRLGGPAQFRRSAQRGRWAQHLGSAQRGASAVAEAKARCRVVYPAVVQAMGFYLSYRRNRSVGAASAPAPAASAATTAAWTTTTAAAPPTTTDTSGFGRHDSDLFQRSVFPNAITAAAISQADTTLQLHADATGRQARNAWRLTAFSSFTAAMSAAAVVRVTTPRLIGRIEKTHRILGGRL